MGSKTNRKNKPTMTEGSVKVKEVEEEADEKAVIGKPK
jgi:hypothetical protein